MCGVGADCNETSTFNVIASPGVTFAGTITFTSMDPLGTTNQADEQIFMTVDNAIAGVGPLSLVVAFVGDQMSTFSTPETAGIGISGQFLADNSDPTETAFAQGSLDAIIGAWNGSPSSVPPFTLSTPTVGGANIPSPTNFWAANAAPVSSGISELVTFVDVSVGSNSEVMFPVDGENNDPDALAEDAPEPGSYFLFGAGLVACGVIRRKYAAR